ncbi:MAG: TetR/AcrR family transcriptional regulator [Deltaproteobacteria bacterium]|nr:TetR/AcrR family transcriptional regulator [Deltaproteobacteria bacterium]
MGELRRATGTRQVELTDAALHIIATRGIAALSTRSLAQHVGLSSGAIFRHFASLDALLDAVVARVEGVVGSTYPPATLPPIERLERFIEARSKAVGQQLGILRLVLSEQFLLALPKGGSARLSACVKATRAFVTKCLRDGQEAGDFRADLPVEALAPIVMGTVQVLALSSAKGRQRASETRSVRDGLLALLRPPATARTPGAKGPSRFAGVRAPRSATGRARAGGREGGARGRAASIRAREEGER